MPLEFSLAVAMAPVIDAVHVAVPNPDRAMPRMFALGLPHRFAIAIGGQRDAVGRQYWKEIRPPPLRVIVGRRETVRRERLAVDGDVEFVGALVNADSRPVCAGGSGGA